MLNISKRILFTFLILICSPQVNAQSIFDLFISNPDLRSSGPETAKFSRIILYTGGSYYDYYRETYSNGKKQYLNDFHKDFTSIYRFKNYEITAAFKPRKREYFVNDLSNINDRFEVISDLSEYDFSISRQNKNSRMMFGFIYSGRPGGKAELSLNIDKFKLELLSVYLPVEYRFKYKVFIESGEIPVEYTDFTNRFSLYGQKFSIHYKHTFVLPEKGESRYETSIKGYYSLISANYICKDVSVKAEFGFSDIESEMDYRGIEYGRLENLKTKHYNLASNYRISKRYNLSLGVTGVTANAGNGSYFDIWPFTFWDIFMQSRTRLKDFDYSIHMPYAGMNLKFEKRGNKIRSVSSIYAGYYHLFHSGSFIYSERYPIIYPIIYGYRTKELDLSTKIDGLFAIKIKSVWNINNLEISLFLRQLLPVDFSGIKFKKGSGISEPGVSKRTRGGTLVSISIGYFIS